MAFPVPEEGSFRNGKWLKCAVCDTSSPKSPPLHLPCFHFVCNRSECLTTLKTWKTTNGDSKCPTCSSAYNDKDLKKACDEEDLFRYMKGAKCCREKTIRRNYCKTCDTRFCNPCYQKHQTIPGFNKDHIGGTNNILICQQCNFTKIMWYDQEKKPVCPGCDVPLKTEVNSTVFPANFAFLITSDINSLKSLCNRLIKERKAADSETNQLRTKFRILKEREKSGDLIGVQEHFDKKLGVRMALERSKSKFKLYPRNPFYHKAFSFIDFIEDYLDTDAFRLNISYTNKYKNIFDKLLDKTKKYVLGLPSCDGSRKRSSSTSSRDSQDSVTVVKEVLHVQRPRPMDPNINSYGQHEREAILNPGPRIVSTYSLVGKTTSEKPKSSSPKSIENGSISKERRHMPSKVADSAQKSPAIKSSLSKENGNSSEKSKNERRRARKIAYIFAESKKQTSDNPVLADRGRRSPTPKSRLPNSKENGNSISEEKQKERREREITNTAERSKKEKKGSTPTLADSVRKRTRSPTPKSMSKSKEHSNFSEKSKKARTDSDPKLSGTGRAKTGTPSKSSSLNPKENTKISANMKKISANMRKISELAPPGIFRETPSKPNLSNPKGNTNIPGNKKISELAPPGIFRETPPKPKSNPKGNTNIPGNMKISELAPPRIFRETPFKPKSNPKGNTNIPGNVKVSELAPPGIFRETPSKPKSNPKGNTNIPGNMKVSELTLPGIMRGTPSKSSLSNPKANTNISGKKRKDSESTLAVSVKKRRGRPPKSSLAVDKRKPTAASNKEKKRESRQNENEERWEELEEEAYRKLKLENEKGDSKERTYKYPNEVKCGICFEAGKIIQCDGSKDISCRKSFHYKTPSAVRKEAASFGCHIPQIKCLPEEEWQCFFCLDKEKLQDESFLQEAKRIYHVPGNEGIYSDFKCFLIACKLLNELFNEKTSLVVRQHLKKVSEASYCGTPITLNLIRDGLLNMRKGYVYSEMCPTYDSLSQILRDLKAMMKKAETLYSQQKSSKDYSKFLSFKKKYDEILPTYTNYAFEFNFINC